MDTARFRCWKSQHQNSRAIGSLRTRPIDMSHPGNPLYLTSTNTIPLTQKTQAQHTAVHSSSSANNMHGKENYPLVLSYTL